MMAKDQETSKVKLYLSLLPAKISGSFQTILFTLLYIFLQTLFWNEEPSPGKPGLKKLALSLGLFPLHHTESFCPTPQRCNGLKQPQTDSLLRNIFKDRVFSFLEKQRIHHETISQILNTRKNKYISCKSSFPPSQDLHLF